MSEISELEPREVFYWFEKISEIPRGSYHTKDISDYCVAFAKKRGLWAVQDAQNNVIIKKPATKGYEDCEPIILQGHLDMVCEKRADSAHDFSKEPLDLYVEDGFLKAKDTTLGADDGVAVAYALALLDGDAVEHPPLEVVFTTDEEVGMLGADKLDLSPLEGRMLLNLDSDEEGVLLAGCAGGFDFTMDMPLAWERLDGFAMDLQIGGLQGGHSGAQIHQQHGNANKLAGRLISYLDKQADIRLYQVAGGTKDNVIPSQCDIKIVAGDARKVKSLCETVLATWKAEFGSDEPGLFLQVKTGEEGTHTVMEAKSMEKVVCFLLNCPDGVHEYSRFLKGLVETSDNLGVVATNEQGLHCKILTRSGTRSKLEEFKERLSSLAKVLGASFHIEGEYPAWSYKETSRIRPIVAAAYEKVTGREPVVTTIHAGLECGLFCGKKPELDCISFGPQMFDIHSVNERLDIASTRQTWELLKEILRQCGRMG